MTANDVDDSKTADGDFDIAAAVSARAFWTGVVESLGVDPAPSLLDMDSEFRKALTVGRAIS